ncbi:CvfB family protein [Thiothrix fructosivorans]|uniref:GntR family transcriptional regulator n=1 Tax=Thiothrix fructosivorans TaxID=111770 RepID=A0A8B0SK07_9GAMM|nr:S1-like domain-containing RNA-binding protein [Thiothrix fructosivorans]MBO0614464.1 GntR family transcriptional regulator [Thiothrix fructosivorans]QTX09302.1 GntR family transcriptional regulator [Thiothrix fructosivorans]
MLKIGKFNLLRVTKTTGFGVYVDGGNYGEILLPKRYVPKDCQPESWINVFIYLDSEDRLIATTETPLAQVGEVACLKVVAVNRFGAFLDWGLPKDLLVPRKEQATLMQEGQSYVVCVYVDDLTETIVASSRLDLFLNEFSSDFTPRQPVELMIYERTELGYKAVIEATHLGLLYANEVFQPLRVGQRVQGYIKAIRPDKKIDLILQLPSPVVQDAVAQKILDHLQARGGTSTFTDKSSPEDIYREFQVSKAHFKRAIGLLYKQQKIVMGKDLIRLAE